MKTVSRRLRLAFVLSAITYILVFANRYVLAMRSLPDQRQSSIHPRVQTVDHDRKIVSVFDLKVPFPVPKGRLSVCAKPPLFDPMEACERLYLIRPSRPLEVQNLNQLRGWVQIETPQAALAYVRLRTSPRTFYLFRYQPPTIREVEVLSSQDVTPELLFGGREGAGGARGLKDMEGYCGIINRKTAQQLGIPAAKCTSSGAGFEVQRVLFVEGSKDKRNFVKSTEWVGKDGEYKEKGRVPFPMPKRPSVSWRIPVFE